MIRKLRKESQLGDGWHGCGSSHRKSENHFGTISKIFLYTHVYIIYIYIYVFIFHLFGYGLIFPVLIVAGW